ncbi:ExeA family protein [Pseudohalioglobus lutimaris]|uniref:General secretion pathway protein n=1 Tax=Pseudohalioglobus lutimaris TaxID=1737061 RepID=A0A2N5WXT4_9GAMM|nr:AAA family ATPase [Pseudohalioglobus lutimaris]PLW67049.1 general secretion pathway protein [Pseudohalioglobus lutimaris]
MYTEYFGLDDKPFSLIPDADSVYFSSVHREAYNMLEFGLLEQVGITVITGEVGAGKTTLLRHLLSRTNYDEITLGLVSTPHRAYGTLLQWIINAFRIDTDSNEEFALLQKLQDFLVDQSAEGKRTLVIVDEAQNMTKDDLESLRLLVNINADKMQLLQVILIGQPELLEMFFDPAMSQLAQRVSAEYRLDPLNLLETMSYVRFRLEHVGGSENLFDTSALMAIYYYSGGIPRIINTLCDGSLVAAYGQGRKQVPLDIVLSVVKAKQIGGVHRRGIGSDPERESVREELKVKSSIDLLDIIG